MNIFTKSKTKKALSVVAGAVVGFSMITSTASAALTQTQIDAILALLSSFDADATTIANVEASLKGQTPTTPTTPTTPGTCVGYTFATNLSQGSTGADVMNLQKVLNMDVATQVAASGVGSAGQETQNFGPMTRAAVIKFQNKYAAEVLTPVGLTAGTGFVGSMTRAKLNQMSVCPTDPTTPTDPSTPATGPVSVVLAASSPMQGGLVGSQAAAKLADFEFKGVGTVSSVTLNRTGFSDENALTAVYLYEGNTRLTDAYTFNASGQLTMSNLNLGVNGSRTVSVRADVMATPVGTQSTIAVVLSSFVAGGNANAANVQGGMMTFVAGTLATVSLSGSNTTASGNVDAGTTNYTLWGETLSVGTRSVAFHGAMFRMIGSAPVSSVANAALYVNGVQVATGMPNATGHIMFDATANPLTLTTGSHSVEVRADIVGGADRSFYVTLERAGDMMLMDSTFNAHVALGSGTPNAAGAITINQGTISLTRDTAMDTDVTSSASNQTIGQYKLQAYGEDVKVMTVHVTASTTGAQAGAGLRNLSLYLNGAQVGASQNVPTGAAAEIPFTLGSQLIVPAGQTVTLEVRADMTTVAGAAFVGDIVVDINIPSNQAQAMSSFTLSSAGSPGTFTVTSGSATAAVSKSLSVTNQTVAKNATNARVGSFIIEAGSTEAIRITNVNVAFKGAVLTATDGAVEATDIANLKISLDGGATFRPSVNPNLTGNNFPVDITIPANGSQTVDVYVDVTAATDGETITPDVFVTARGAVSNVALTGTGFQSGSRVEGQTMTVGMGALATVTVLTSANTAAQYVVGPSSNVELIKYNVTTTGGPTTINELTFDITGTAAGALTSLSVEGNQGGSTCTKAVTTNTVTFTGCNIPVPQGFGGTDLTVRANFGTVGFQGVASGAIAWANLKQIVHFNGVESATINLVTSASSPDIEQVASSSIMTLVASVPTFTLGASTEKLQNGQRKLGSVTVTAGTGGNVKLNALPVSIVVSGTGTLVASTSPQYIVLREGNDVIATTFTTNDSNTNAAIVLTLTGNQVVTAGNSRTFDVYASFTGVVTNDSASMSILPASSLSWDDIAGNGTGLAGTLLRNYPTGTVTITN
jgi:hypothetical protein